MNSNDAEDALDYRSAGVDIEAGSALVERIKPVAARTRIPGVLAGLGGFGFSPPPPSASWHAGLFNTAASPPQRPVPPHSRAARALQWRRLAGICATFAVSGAVHEVAFLDLAHCLSGEQ